MIAIPDIYNIRGFFFAAWTMHVQIMMKERPTNCIFKVTHTFRISILLLHVSALQERHLQGDQSILMKLCVCYVVSAEIEIKYITREYIKYVYLWLKY
jgi:hypothetical protein